jgi:hypothetical protein
MQKSAGVAAERGIGLEAQQIQKKSVEISEAVEIMS